jgi:hypothetical protein
LGFDWALTALKEKGRKEGFIFLLQKNPVGDFATVCVAKKGFGAFCNSFCCKEMEGGILQRVSCEFCIFGG